MAIEKPMTAGAEHANRSALFVAGFTYGFSRIENNSLYVAAIPQPLPKQPITPILASKISKKLEPRFAPFGGLPYVSSLDRSSLPNRINLECHAAMPFSISSSSNLARSYLESVMVFPLSRSARTCPPPSTLADSVEGARSSLFAMSWMRTMSC